MRIRMRMSEQFLVAILFLKCCGERLNLSKLLWYHPAALCTSTLLSTTAMQPAMQQSAGPNASARNALRPVRCRFQQLQRAELASRRATGMPLYQCVTINVSSRCRMRCRHGINMLRRCRASRNNAASTMLSLRLIPHRHAATSRCCELILCRRSQVHAGGACWCAQRRRNRGMVRRSSKMVPAERRHAL